MNKLILIGLFVFLAMLNLTAQTTGHPYVKTWRATAPIHNASDILTKPLQDVKQTTQYFDALGRPLQTVSKQASPLGYDMVAMNVYDNLGREPIKYLPYTSRNNSAVFSADPVTDQADFYNTFLIGQNENSFYNKIIFEASPANRPQVSMPPGTSWAGSSKGVESHYMNNTNNDQVILFNVREPVLGELGIYDKEGIYPEGTLSKMIINDEHNNQVIEFKNKAGQVVLKKVQLTSLPDDGNGRDHDGWLCTYYIYDILGNLRAVIPPKATNILLVSGFTPGMLDELCFRYEYDERNRMIMKQVPGANPVWMVYDNKDRLVLTQDGNLKQAEKWLYTLYDRFNRPVETGLWMNTMSWYEHYRNAYDASTYPELNGNIEVLTQNYYDNYSWIAHVSGTPFSINRDHTNDNAFSTTYSQWPYPRPLEQASAVNGMITGTKVKILGTNDDYLFSINYYDDRGRVIQQQSTNIWGGIDISTTQYCFSGQVFMNILRHQSKNLDQHYTVYTKPEYDASFRQIKILKQVDNFAGIQTRLRPVAVMDYDELGQLKNKQLGLGVPTCPSNTPETCTDNPLAKLTYDYNIRGWLLGINREYINNGTDPLEYFGFELAYDKPGSVISGSSYFNQAFNGNISGTTWRSKGDGVQRRYDFGYDNANRLLTADFLQHDPAGWSNTEMNYNVKMGDGVDPLTAYDENGNIKRMQQFGFKLGISYPQPPIDDLEYSYNAESNKLEKVTDTYSDVLTKLGDFKDGTNAAEDYEYDLNGNLKKDYNKGIENIKYNYINLPQTIIIPDKGSIDYIYDATGNKLRKIVHEEGKPGKTTTYIAGFVYEDDKLKFLSHEEGRIRYNTNEPTSDKTFPFDYFLKDHLGNVRVVLTEELQKDKYPVASLEDAKLATEEQYYSIDETKIVTASSLYPHVPPTYTNDNGIGNNPADNSFSNANSQKLYKINGTAGTASSQMGLGITLKVMAGDKLDIFGKSYYYANNTGGTPVNSAIPIIDILTGFLGSPGAVASTGLHGVVSPATIGTTAYTNGINQMLQDQSTESAETPQTPKAYINYLLFDEQFKCVGKGFSKVGPKDLVKDHHSQLQNITVPKNGYVYIYCSNESPVDVFFDNLQVVHTRGPVLEETSYYPFGLTMSGISSKAAGGLENKIFFSGKELQSQEFNDGSGLDLYDYGARFYDAQIGMWHSPDPLSEKYPTLSPYIYTFNNPMLFVDPDGRDNIIYLVAADESVSSKQLKKIAKQATANFAANKLKTEVRVFKGKFDANAYKQLEKTDAVAVIGQKDNVIATVKTFNEKQANTLNTDGFGRNGVDNQVDAEDSQNPRGSKNPNDGNIIAVATDPTSNLAGKANSTFEEMAGHLIFHGAGHNSNLEHASAMNGYDENGNSDANISVPGTPNIMTNGTVAVDRIKSGRYNETLSSYTNSPINTQPKNNSKNELSIQAMYIKRFGNNTPTSKIPGQ